MAGTVSWDALRELAQFRAEKGCAISVYLDLDPSTTATAGDIHTRVNSLLDEGGKSDGAQRNLTHDQKQALRADFARIERFFQEEFERDGARGFAVFAAGLDNFWKQLPLTETVPDRVMVGSHFYVAPLVPLVGRGEGALVAVIGRERGQVYRLTRGRLEEVVDQFDEQPGQHNQGGWSQARYQRHIENLVHGHVKAVGEHLDRRVRRLRSPQLVVVTTEELQPEVESALSTETANALVGWAQAEAHATPAELLEVALPVLEQANAEQEAKAVERWREEAGRNGRAAAGWEATLESASDGRVDLLVFQEGADRPGWECPACGRAAASQGACPLDGTQMESHESGVDLAVQQTLLHGGSVLAVRHHHDLEPVEGVGAILRY